MVLDDVFNSNYGAKNSKKRRERRTRQAASRLEDFPLADPLDRWAALVVDFIILIPTVSLFLALLRRQVIIFEWLGRELDVVLYLGIYALLSVIIIVFYQSFFYSRWAATPGKMFFGLRVVSIWDKSPPAFGAAVLRSIFWVVGACLLFLPQLAVFYHRERRPIYDRLADTVVISRNRFTYGAPAEQWGTTMRGSMAAFYTFLFVALVGTGIRAYLDGYQKNPINFFLSDGPETCTAVDKSLTPDQASSTDARIKRALSLFAAGLLDVDCLDREADSALWNSEKNEQAYLAKAFVFSEEDDIFENYVEKVCDLNKKSPSCKLATAAKSWDYDSPDKLNPIFNKLMATDQEDDVKLWGIRHWMKTLSYDKALTLIDSLSANNYLGDFLSEQRIKALWGSGDEDSARSALYVYLQNTTRVQRIKTATWFCFMEAAKGCSKDQEHVCDLVDDTLKEFSFPISDPEVTVAQLRSQECRFGRKMDYQEFTKDVPHPVSAELLRAVNLEKTNPKKAKKQFKSLFIDEEVNTTLRAEAGYRWLELENDKQGLREIEGSWKDTKWEMGEYWTDIGVKLFSKLHSSGDHNLALKVGKELDKVAGNEALRRNLVVSSYLAGNEKFAWKILSKLQKQAIRSPASNDNFNSIEKKLKRKFKK